MWLPPWTARVDRVLLELFGGTPPYAPGPASYAVLLARMLMASSKLALAPFFSASRWGLGAGRIQLLMEQNDLHAGKIGLTADCPEMHRSGHGAGGTAQRARSAQAKFCAESEKGD